MIIYLFCILLGIVLSSSILYIFIKPELNKIQEKNKKIEDYNLSLEQKNQYLKIKNEELTKDQIKLTGEINKITSEINILENQIKSNKEHFLSLKQRNEEWLQTNMQLAQEKLNKKEEELNKAFEQYQEKCKEEYLTLCKESKEDYETEINPLKEKLEQLNSQIEEKKGIVHAAVEEHKRRESEEQEKMFYRIVLSNAAKEEIKKIKEIIPYVSDPEPINKVIWKVYYEKPTSDLIGRVIGEGVKSGIYKITEPNSKKCYVGQSVNLSERFKQHIKRGLGAEPITKNKLYPAMQEIGVENFTFEVIEECPKEKLDEREDFWQEYFEAKTWGYSIK